MISYRRIMKEVKHLEPNADPVLAMKYAIILAGLINGPDENKIATTLKIPVEIVFSFTAPLSAQGLWPPPQEELIGDNGGIVFGLMISVSDGLLIHNPVAKTYKMSALGVSEVENRLLPSLGTTKEDFKRMDIEGVGRLLRGEKP